MNDTVAVALITSLSTLAAAGMAGTASALTTGRQLRHQAALAREERAEQRASAQRELRREVYERFLTRADAAYRVLDEEWLARGAEDPQRAEAGFAARRALDEAYVRVRLVGPEGVAVRGAGVVEAIGGEFRRQARAPEAEVDPSARAAALRARVAVGEEFVAEARWALGVPG
ncbi:hypothetical protein K7472_09060 [Streptomyces sp. PTM05]|uniref:Uncharacterized protein n=1 Tax=Streptantibioticus parmotrematis TaxID=2873249 RepID=A0ABS7QP77_9ACTN|nr:hypothetical protein [Streptantibioticus parmotrematis]MBY8884992.1 hypothetical protein [Streptantibioticus parmotrematis]